MSEVIVDTSTIIVIIVIVYASMSIVRDRVGAIATITLAEWSAEEAITATAALSCRPTSSLTATLGQFKHSSRSRWYQTPHRNIRLRSPDSSHFDRWEEVQDDW